MEVLGWMLCVNGGGWFVRVVVHVRLFGLLVISDVQP